MSRQTEIRESTLADIERNGSIETDLGPAPRERSQLRGWDLLLVFALTASLLYLARFLIGGRGASVEFVIAMLALQSAITIGIVYAVIIRFRGLTWSEIGLHKPPRGWVARAALVALLTIPVVTGVNYATQRLIGGPFRNPQLDFLAPDGFSWRGLIGMAVMAGFVAPVIEEIVFRGLIYGWLRARFGLIVGLFVSALAFALAHGVPILIPALAVNGIILALAFERSGSLWPPIIIHGLFNTMMTVLLYAALAAGLPSG